MHEIPSIHKLNLPFIHQMDIFFLKKKLVFLSPASSYIFIKKITHILNR
jgi:hypothetical protein